MRHDVADLIRFPQEGALNIKVDLVKRLSPGSLSVMEFKSENDIRIAEKMLSHQRPQEAAATGQSPYRGENRGDAKRFGGRREAADELHAGILAARGRLPGLV